MSYTCDIYLNFNTTLYDFFDWYKQDKIICVRKIPIIKTNTQTFIKILNNKIKIDISTLNSIIGKTETYSNNNEYKNCALFCDNNNVIAISFNANGISEKKSFLLINDELDVLEYTSKKEEKKIKIKILSEDKITLKTRHDIYEENFINKELKDIDDERLNYIYFECFNKKEKESKKIIKKIKSINKDSKNYKTLYNILKLTSTSKNT